jgi:hypothetical protein
MDIYLHAPYKVKILSLCLTKNHTMKTNWGRGGIAPRILDLSTRWRWVGSFTPGPLHPQGKSTWYPLDRRLSGPQSRSGHGGEEKNSQPPPGIEPYTQWQIYLYNFCIANRKLKAEICDISHYSWCAGSCIQLSCRCNATQIEIQVNSL